MADFEGRCAADVTSVFKRICDTQWRNDPAYKEVPAVLAIWACCIPLPSFYFSVISCAGAVVETMKAFAGESSAKVFFSLSAYCLEPPSVNFESLPCS
ncbi:hypothetical protein V5799_002333 [Amblyomma americanum]|uniref:Uncharacterized protein n=1 Tax=Amblyomma americanum TaxID=6943 RepID=A0AAQ4CXM2_AMBAM